MHKSSYSSYVHASVFIGLLFVTSIQPLTEKEKVGWGTVIVMSAAINMIVWQLIKKQPSEGLPVCPVVESFVRKQLVKINLENPASIKVRSHKTIFFAASHDTIYIREDMVAKIESLLARAYYDAAANKSLNKYRAVIQHEGGHIKHAHAFKGLMASALAPAGCIGTFLWIKEKLSLTNPVRNLMDAISHIALEVENGKYIFQFPQTILLLAFSRYHERQADGCMVDDVAILQGGIDMFEELRADNGDVEGWAAYLSTHPTLKERILNLKERIKRVKRAHN